MGYIGTNDRIRELFLVQLPRQQSRVRSVKLGERSLALEYETYHTQVNYLYVIQILETAFHLFTILHPC